MTTSFARTLRCVILPTIFCFIWINPSMCSSTESNESGCSGSSDSSYDTVPPTVPTGLTAEATSPWVVELTWNPSIDIGSGVATYELQRLPPDEGSIWTPTTSATDADRTAGTEYCYRVRAVDRYGNASMFSAAVCATTHDPAPDRIAATSIGVLPDQTVQIAFTVSATAGPAVRTWMPLEPRVHATTFGAPPLGAGPLAVYPEDAVLAVPSPTTGSTLRLPVPDLAGTWLGTAPSPDVTEGRFARALYAADGLHAAFHDLGSGGLAYARWDTRDVLVGSWTVDEGRGLDDVGRYPTIARASEGPVHIVYVGVASGRLEHAWGGAGTWDTEILPFPRTVDPRVGLGVGPSGELHLGVFDLGSNTLLYATNASHEWKLAAVDDDVSGAVALAVDATGCAHVAYAGWDGSTLRYASNVGGDWTVVAMPSGRD